MLTLVIKSSHLAEHKEGGEHCCILWEMGHSHGDATRMEMGPRPEQGHNHNSKMYRGKEPGNVGWIKVGWINGR